MDHPMLLHYQEIWAEEYTDPELMYENAKLVVPW